MIVLSPFLLSLHSSFIMIVPLKHVIEYIANHPILLFALVVILVFIVFSMIKKFLKFAFILLLIFVVVNALIIYFADADWAKKGKQLIEQTTKKAEETIKKESKKLIQQTLTSEEDSTPTNNQKKKK